MRIGDTIAAISSSVGCSPRMIVRLSGPRAWELAMHFCPEAQLISSGRIDTRFKWQGLWIPCQIYSFHAASSYTGEDQIEFHLPGNVVICKSLLNDLLMAGARSAEAGEYTFRAYFNQKMDLSEAEGVAATIAAQGRQELAAARQLMSGELSRRLMPVMDVIAETLALIEVGIDFSQEDVSVLDDAEVDRRISQSLLELNSIVSQSSRFEKLTHEPRVVLVGRPNAGKSTLINCLCGHQRAIVSAIAGTTRDALSASVALSRGMIRMIDCAGLEQIQSNQTPVRTEVIAEIETQMQSRSLRELESADLVLLCHDPSDLQSPMKLPRQPNLVVFTKQDMVVADVQTEESSITVSAMTGFGIDQLKQSLDQLAFGSENMPSQLALNIRHVNALELSIAALSRAQAAVGSGHELVALELRDVLNELGEVLGTISPDDMLGRIFAKFCIGK